MAQSFAVSAVETKVKLSGEPQKPREGRCTFIVTNNSAASITGRVKVIPQGETKKEWFTVEASSIEREYAPSESFNVTVNISIPPDIPSGTYSFRLDAFAEEHPHEDYTEGQTMKVEVEPSPPPAKKTNWWLYLLIGGAIVLLLVIVVLVISCPGETRVPDLSGLAYTEARNTLDEIGLEDSIVQSDLPPDTSSWIVVEQNPAAETPVEENSTVELVIGAQIPSVVGETESAGRNILSQSGFAPVKAGERDTGLIPGRIVETQPPAQDVTRFGGEVQYWVRSGTVVDQDCLPFNPENLEIRQEGSRFLLTDGRSRMKTFASRLDADRTLAVIRHYEMNSHCFIGRPNSSLEYWLTDGLSPQGSMGGEDCLEFNPQNLSIVRRAQPQSLFFLMDGSQLIRIFPNSQEARKALDIIQMFGFTNMCFVGGRTNPAMIYLKK